MNNSPDTSWKNCPHSPVGRWDHVRKLIITHQKLKIVAREVNVSLQTLSNYLHNSKARLQWWEHFRARLKPMRRAAREQRWRTGKRLRLLLAFLDGEPFAWFGLPAADQALLLARGYDPPTYDPGAAGAPPPA